MQNTYQFISDKGVFSLPGAADYSDLYFPVAGECGIKSAVTPTLGGDCKLDQNTFLLEPVSVENLHNNRNARNFWCHIGTHGSWSATGNSAEEIAKKFTDLADENEVTAGFMWQTVTRTSRKYQLSAQITSFVPLDDPMEIMYVEITNTGNMQVRFTPTAAIPVYGRSADNLRDHRHVTSLLHRIRTVENGVLVTPTMSFDERGHRPNEMTYFVCGYDQTGEAPEDFYPTVQDFIGEGGNFERPKAVVKNLAGVPAGSAYAGCEAVGGLHFKERILAPGETAGYTIMIGAVRKTEYAGETILSMTAAYRTAAQTKAAYERMKTYWEQKVNVSYHTKDRQFDRYMQWVSFQPILRRIYGCSFLPHHDYGKGGRGWRDLWQDCLALLIMEPSVVRQMIVDNYGGVRMDGTNATIIGSRQGEFIADRNNITRVWMDHAFWPFVTTKLYLDQTGDLDILLEKVTYFKDLQTKRGTAHDNNWDHAYGNKQRTAGGNIYFGTILEHILLQNLCAFYDVGEHNEMRLHGADWNDALDMAWEKGESVAFTCAYAGNLKDIADCLKHMEEKTGISKIEMAEEMKCLLAEGTELYESPDRKQKLLDEYTSLCEHNVKGGMILVSTEQIRKNLVEKAEWLMQHIREKEWISAGDDMGWFNGYYDNHGNAVEYSKKDEVRMMLTGQVFAVMSKTAGEEQVKEICRSADKFLFDQKAGGYRLNTDFKEEKFDLGRMFGFAYGEKENGAVFSHMTVMYANALYQRGFIREGHKVLQTLLEAAMNFENSKMYPGLPEYFDNEGRGLYAYLTGAASWYMLTMITEVFGVKGDLGDLVIAPSLLPEQFDEKGSAGLKLEFARKKFEIIMHNPEKKDLRIEQIRRAVCDEKVVLEPEPEYGVRLRKSVIETLDPKKCHRIDVFFQE